MIIIADSRIPEAALSNLKEYGQVIPFQTSGITYEAISGHPDIFFSKIHDKLIIAPNLPERYKQILNSHGVVYSEGELPVGAKYPETAKYNVVCTDEYLIHNFRYTDSEVTRAADDVDLIHVDQGYTRCNLIPLGGKRFMTSDSKVFRVLKRYDLDVFFVDPKGIILPGFKHGFFGGACGIHGNKFFVIGSLITLDPEKEIRSYIEDSGYKIIELYDGPLFDGGSILFEDANE